MTVEACIKEAMTEVADRIEEILTAMLPTGNGPEARLFEAMAYIALGGGKRLRPFLAVQTGRLFDVPDSRSLRAGAAIEFIHCYSLVHDDLPALDDDDLRRGKPSSHIRFDADLLRAAARFAVSRPA